jgi:hypothetical protein
MNQAIVPIGPGFPSIMIAGGLLELNEGMVKR